MVLGLLVGALYYILFSNPSAVGVGLVWVIALVGDLVRVVWLVPFVIA